MKHIIHVLLILICVVALVSCKDKASSSNDIQNTEPNISESNEPLSPESTAALPADTFEIVGNVTYKNIEGGFYAIDGDNGSKYDPINLPEPFRKDGLRVKVTARRKMDAMSLHMYGAIIEVVNIAAQ
ncbi:MAG: hypothetical protein GY774_04450 [Planctomycetes bacterium]|nr:hypothetical protein [Planctomycetota bacterium]